MGFQNKNELSQAEKILYLRWQIAAARMGNKAALDFLAEILLKLAANEDPIKRSKHALPST